MRPRQAARYNPSGKSRAVKDRLLDCNTNARALAKPPHRQSLSVSGFLRGMFARNGRVEREPSQSSALIFRRTEEAKKFACSRCS
jgi:hypothetical protein